MAGIESVRVELNDAGIQELLNSPGVQAFLAGKANQVQRSAQAAGGQYGVSVSAGQRRSRARVYTIDLEAMKRSSESATLAKAGYSAGGTPGRS